MPRRRNIMLTKKERKQFQKFKDKQFKKLAGKFTKKQQLALILTAGFALPFFETRFAKSIRLERLRIIRKRKKRK